MRDLDEYPAEVGRFNAVRADAGLPPIPTKIASFIYCAESTAQAEEEGVQYVLDYYASLENHYHWSSSDKYKKIDSYQFYADLGEQRSKATEADTVAALIKNGLFGTPTEIVEKVEAHAEASGCDEVISPFLYGKMPFEKAEKMTRLFLTEALPKIQKLPVKQPADSPDGHRSAHRRGVLSFRPDRHPSIPGIGGWLRHRAFRRTAGPAQ